MTHFVFTQAQLAAPGNRIRVKLTGGKKYLTNHYIGTAKSYSSSYRNWNPETNPRDRDYAWLSAEATVISASPIADVERVDMSVGDTFEVEGLGIRYTVRAPGHNGQHSGDHPVLETEALPGFKLERFECGQYTYAMTAVPV